MKNTQTVELLKKVLANSYLLYLKTQNYHWNVTGKNFVGLHQLFEQHYQALHEAGDVVAERIRALGHFAPGTLAEFAALSSVSEDRKLPANADEMIMNLIKSHEICSKEAHQVLDTAQKPDDEVTADVMIQRMAFHDKSAWMLRALLAE